MPATICLIAVNVIVFAVYLFKSSFIGLLTYDGPVLMDMGAAYTPNILYLHQYWRLVTAVFLHANVQHIFINMFSLFVFGRMLEKPMGTSRFVVLYAVAGLFGGLASMGVVRLDERVGASGAIFGLVGFYLFLQLQLEKKAHPSAIYRLRQAIGMALALYCLSLTPGVDNSAHLGGLVAGIACGAAFQKLSNVKVLWCWRDFVISIVFAAFFAATLYIEQRTIGQSPAMSSALILRAGMAKLQAHDLNGALTILNNALTLDPKNEKALLVRAMINHDRGRDDQAEADTTAALAINPDDALLLNLQACILLAKGQYAPALLSARRAVANKEHFPEAIDSEATALMYSGQLDQALTVINRALSESEGEGGIYFYHRSMIYAAQGDRAKAEADLAQAHKLGFELEKWEINRPLPKAGPGP